MTDDEWMSSKRFGCIRDGDYSNSFDATIFCDKEETSKNILFLQFGQNSLDISCGKNENITCIRIIDINHLWVSCKDLCMEV